MSKECAGYIVKTKGGLIGRTRHSDKRVNGKVIVYLEQDGKPVLDENNQPKKLLCDVAGLELVGFNN